MTEKSIFEIVIGKRHIPYKLTRSNSAEKLKLTMTMDNFRVTAPAKATDSEIESALKRKHKWIIESYAALQDKYDQTHKVARFRTGAKIPYWGRLTRLRTQITAVEYPRVQYIGGLYIEHPKYVTSTDHDDAIEAALHDYLKQRFSDEVEAFARKYCDSLDVRPRSLRVTAMSKRWGSCTKAGSVSLDWRLVYAPKRVVGYVVAHELTHLKVNNHSQKFWNLLNGVYGEYQREHEWLEKNEHMLGYKRLAVHSSL